MTGKIVLVTGETGSIGGAMSRVFANTGATVIMMGRDKTRLGATVEAVRSQTRNSNVEGIIADFADLGSVRQAAQQFSEKYPCLNVLINNAAVFKGKRVLTPAGLETMFCVNHLGPFFLTNLLLPSLKAGSPARIFNVSAPSTTSLDFQDLQGEKKFSAFRAFGASKMANLLFTYDLAKKLDGAGINANVYFPGLVKSGLVREMPRLVTFIFGLISKPPEEAAEGILHLSSAPALEKTTGKMFKFKKEVKSNAYSHDPENQKKLWIESAKLAGLPA